MPKLYSVTATQSALQQETASDKCWLVLKPISTSLDADNAVGSSDGKPKFPSLKLFRSDFRNEPIQNVFNYVLQLSGLEANRIGSTIFVGSRKLPDSVQRNESSVPSRLNQVNATVASNFLATQGAESQVATTRVDLTTVGTGSAERIVETRTPDILSLKRTRRW